VEDEEDDEDHDHDDKPIASDVHSSKKGKVSAGKKKRDDALKSEVCLPFQIYFSNLLPEYACSVL
jgi:hypothetical protein